MIDVNIYKVRYYSSVTRRKRAMMVRMPDLTKSTVALKSPVLASRAMTRPFPWMAWVTDEPTQTGAPCLSQALR